MKRFLGQFIKQTYRYLLYLICEVPNFGILSIKKQFFCKNFFIGSQDRKKHRKISETATLPTIPDEHHQEHPEPNKDAETESELEDDTVSSFKTKTLKNNFTEFFFVGTSEKIFFHCRGF